MCLFSLAVSPCEEQDKTKGPTRIGPEGGVEKGPNGSEVIIPAGSVGTDYSEWQKCKPEECGVPTDVEITKESVPKDLVPPEGAEVFSDVYIVRASRHVFAPNPVSKYMFIIKIPLKDRVAPGEEVCSTDLAELWWCTDFEGEDLDPSGRFVLARSAELYGPDSPAVIRLPGTPTELKLVVFRKTPEKLPQVAPQRASVSGRYFEAFAPKGIAPQQVQAVLTSLDASIETYRRLGFREPKLDAFSGSQAFRLRILRNTTPPCTDPNLLGQYEPQQVEQNGVRAPSGWRPHLIICQRSLSEPAVLQTTAAHELFHAIQFSYFNWPRFRDAWEEGKPLLWFTEGSAEALAGTVAAGGTPQATSDYDPLSLKDSVLADRVCENRGGTLCYQAQDFFVFLALSRTDSIWGFLKQALQAFAVGTDAVSALEAALAPGSIQKSYLAFAEERAYRHAQKIHAAEIPLKQAAPRPRPRKITETFLRGGSSAIISRQSCLRLTD